MAKLTRFTMPVFAGSATQDQTSVFGTMKTSPQYTSDVAASIDTTAYSNGWTDAVELGYAPFLEDNNTIHKAITYQIAYGQQQGIPEWASDTEYYIGSLAKLNTATGSEVYSSLIDNNVGNLLSDTTKWKKVFDSNLQTQINTKANTADVVNLTGTQTITGPKTFQGTGFITYIQNTDITYNTAPSSDKSVAIAFTDKNGIAMGVVESWRYPNNSTCTQLNVYGANGNWSSRPLSLVVYPDGYSVAYAPTPNVNASGEEIATAAYVKNVLSALYPVGSLYIGTQNSCPLASLISGSQWQIIATDCALWGGNGSNGNTWIPAGLPNIWGRVGFIRQEGQSTVREPSGAFYWGGESTATYTAGDSYGSSTLDYIDFNASSSNSIYGNSNTVQPPAYRVNVWRRTA